MYAPTSTSSPRSGPISGDDDSLTDFEVMETVRTLLVSLQPVMRRVPVVPVLKGPERLKVRSYPSALIQVLTNLMMNSALHAFEGVESPEISIEVADEKDVWTLTYRDNGVGVAPDLHKRIFEPFFTTRRGRGGTGLGLNIVYTLVTQRLGGRLEFWSDSAAGLRFRLDLPLSATSVAILRSPCIAICQHAYSTPHRAPSVAVLPEGV